MMTDEEFKRRLRATNHDDGAFIEAVMEGCVTSDVQASGAIRRLRLRQRLRRQRLQRQRAERDAAK